MTTRLQERLNQLLEQDNLEEALIEAGKSEHQEEAEEESYAIISLVLSHWDRSKEEHLNVYEELLKIFSTLGDVKANVQPSGASKKRNRDFRWESAVARVARPSAARSKA